MKILLSLCIAAFAVAPAQAQIIRSGVAFRVSDHRDYGNGRHTSVHVGVGHGGGWYGHGWSPWRHSHYVGYRPSWYYSPRVIVAPAYYPEYAYYGGYGYDDPYYSRSTYYPATSAAANGLALGAIAGGIIGHNSGEFRHNGWRGAAWGAGLGWLLGTVVDANRRAVAYQNAAPVVQQAPALQAAPAVQAAPAQQPQQITIINNYYNSSNMSAANGLFGR